jgi:hypothetical protein
MGQQHEEVVLQVKSEILTALRSLAEQEGRQLQVLVEEAFSDLLEKRKNSQPRAQVMSTYLASHEKYGALYRKLAE